MNFDLPDECRQIAAEVRRALADVCPLREVRDCLDHGETSARAWRVLVELGVIGTVIPERWGGLGLSHLELSSAAEEIGRACAPVPSLASVYLGTEALLTAGTDAQRERWLPLLASGRLVATAVAAGTDAAYPEAMATGATRETSPPMRQNHGLQGIVVSSGLLSGTLHQVPAGMQASVALVAVGSDAFCVDLADRRVTRQSQRSIDPGFPLATLHFDEAPVESMAGPIDGIVDRAAVLLAFEQLGGADRALAMACDYARERRAFGRRIGEYQAIKHKLADVWTRNELARAHAYFGAWALSTSAPVLPRAAAAARVAASDAFECAAQENLQVHGGFGFTWEADCHPYYKRARSTALALGAPALWKKRLIAAVARERGGSDGLR